MSPEKPRPEPDDRATNFRRLPSFSSIPSSPVVYRMWSTSFSSRGVPSISDTIRRNASLAVLNSCALCRISRVSGSQNRPCSSRASRIDPFPFWRGTTSPTSNDAHRPLGRGRSVPSRTWACQGSRTSPARAARTTAASPRPFLTRGTLRYLGSRVPSSPSLSKLIGDRLLLAARERRQRLQHVRQLLRQRRRRRRHRPPAHLARRAVLDLGRQLVPE